VLLVGSALSLKCSMSDRTPQETEEAIAKSVILRHVDKLCAELPSPSGFVFVDKVISGNSELASISYQYQSRLPADEAQSFYRKFLQSAGWKVGTSGRYEREKQQVSFGPIGFPRANFYVYCAELY